MQFLLENGLNLNLLIQSLGGWLEAPMKFFTFLGTEEFFMLALPAIYWCLDAALGIRIGFILLAGNGLNSIFKLLFAGPRPYWYSAQVKAFAAETSFGAPSGHAQIATGVWGTAAGWLRRLWAWIVAGLIIFLIGFSRMYLGVHFPHDVVLGWLIGGVTLWAFLTFWDPVARWLKKQTFWMQALLALLTSLAFILLGFLARLRLGGYELPADQLANALRAGEAPTPLDLSGLFTVGGTFFGLGLGLALIMRAGGFRVAGVWWKRVLRYVLGLVGVVILWMGLGAVFPDGETLVPFALRFLRYGLIGFWVAAAAPWLFWRIGLAERPQPRRAHSKRAVSPDAPLSKRAAPRR